MELEKIFKDLDLHAEIDCNKWKPIDIAKRLSLIFSKGIEEKQKGIFRDAYIYLRRWQCIVKWLETKKNLDPSIRKQFNSDQKKDIQTQIDDIKNIIKIEYESRERAAQVQLQNEIGKDVFFPEIPDDEPQPKRKDEITCTELFKLFTPGIKNEKRILIIDVRKEDDYARSKIAFSKNLIHIPANKIEPKKVAGVYRSMILHNKEAHDLFQKRSSKYTDLIVLVDYNSSVETMKPFSPIALFKESLEKYDSATDYKIIAVLKGGFDEWLNTYPEHVTHTKKKSSMESVNDAFLETDYDFLTLSQPFEDITLSSNLSQNHMNKNYNVGESPTLENKISDKQLLLSNNIKEAKVLINKLPLKPAVDRTNKPVAGKKILNSVTVEELERELRDSQFLITQFSKHPLVNDPWKKEQLEVNIKKEQELKLALNKLRTSQSTNSKSIKLYPDLPNISKMSISSKKPEKNSPEIEKKENKENILVSKKTIEQKPVVKVEIMQVEPKIVQVQEMEVEDTYQSSCKSDKLPMNSGLKRSYSSPNLALQVKKLKSHQKVIPKSVPEIDRATKPKEVSICSRIIVVQHRERNLDPIFSSSPVNPGITGLKNLGNSCYMNSIIQCLSNTEYVANYFNNYNYLKDLSRNSDKNVTVAEEVAQVIKALWRGQYKSISPRDLKAVVGLYKTQFDSHEQQDSHEFLMFLLDWMHNDLKQESKNYYNQQQTVAEKEWEKQMDGQSSIISKLFFGQLKSTIECLYCTKNSDTYDTFNSLTLSLPSSSKCSLDECVKKYVSGQKVSGWKCPSCGIPRDGVKKFEISMLPHIVVIHLNRFHFTDTGSWLEKKNTAVDFPLTNLDLRPYLIQNLNTAAEQVATYNLYAMSNHYGTMEGGHYTAYCKSNTNSKWYKYDDHTVTEVPQYMVKNQSSSAYLLFYSSTNAKSFLNT